MVSAKRRHGPLSDISGALWVFLQGFHDLTVVQHQSHELVLLLGLGRGAVDGADQFQLLKVLEGLRAEQRRGQDWRTLLSMKLQTNLHDDGSLKVVNGVWSPLQELLVL